jgi:hypothetical protein
LQAGASAGSPAQPKEPHQNAPLVEETIHPSSHDATITPNADPRIQGFMSALQLKKEQVPKSTHENERIDTRSSEHGLMRPPYVHSWG